MENKSFVNKLILITSSLFALASCSISSSSSLSSSSVPNPAARGLDEILGEDGKVKPQSIVCSEDSYVINGESAANDSVGKNYGSSDSLFIKGYTSGNTNCRITFLKFNLTELKSRTITFATLGLYCYSAQDSVETTLNVYGAPSQFWDEDSITYSNMPELGSLVASKKQSGSGYISFDMTSFLKTFIARGNNVISFAIVNEPDKEAGEDAKRFSISSRESSNKAQRPHLDFSFGKSSFTTSLNTKEGDINPWEYAADCVDEYLARKALIEENGSTNSEVISWNGKEFSMKVDAARAEQTDGDNTKYTTYDTRGIDTLIGYSYNPNEKNKYDEYGGIISEDKYDATGYFYTKFINGRWYTIDPLGNKYYRAALNTVGTGESVIKNKLVKDYGSVSKFFDYETGHLMDDLGFNCAGAWSDMEGITSSSRHLAVSGIANFASSYGKEVGLNNTTGGSTTFVNGVMPLFDPEFISFSKGRAKEICEPWKDNSDIYGWFLDNELESSLMMLDNFMRVDYEDSTSNYSYAVAYTYLYKKLNKTIFFTNDITDDLRRDFRAMVYDRYFKVTTDAVKEVDPNHMIIGCRFLRNCYQDKQIMQVAGEYCDVISFNYYNTWTADPTLMANCHNYSGKPFAITEWYAKGMDACTKESGLTNKSGAGWSVRTQDDRGKFYENFALSLMESKYCIGFDYFKMWDNNPANTSADSSNTNSNKGIYDIKHNEYAPLTAHISKLNLNKYSIIEFFDAR